ncbi:MAG: hypothetical protein IT440_09240, partial [Phycisphaeraceae bacterium]|nr:hypothetical protein [Phycisphaeraceae bacterium]
ILDDIQAQGATRAILEKCPRRDIENMDLLTVVNRQCLVQLGVPCTYLVSDISEDTEIAMDILRRQLHDEKAPSQDIRHTKCILVTDPHSLLMQDEVVCSSTDAAVGAKEPFAVQE